MRLAVNKSQNEGTPAVFMKKPRAAVVATEETKKPRMQLILGIILLLQEHPYILCIKCIVNRVAIVGVYGVAFGLPSHGVC